MTNDPRSDDFDWVKRRIDCSFSSKEHRNAIREAVRRDVKIAEQCGLAIDLVEEGWGTNRFLVVRRAAFDPRYAMFLFHDNSLRVHVGGEAVLHNDDVEEYTFNVTTVLNDDGRCGYRIQRRLVVTSQGPFPLWRVIEMALSPLFFPVMSTP